jgi:signal peptidase I
MEGHQSDVLGLFEDILRSGVNLRVRVTGRSMMPFLADGETLTIGRVSCCSLHRGDLILFRGQDDRPVLHRILQKRKSGDGTFYFLTKGDALTTFDGEIHEENVLGRVLLIERTLPSGKTRHMDMTSPFYRGMNFSIALLDFFRTHTFYFLSGSAARRM